MKIARINNSTAAALAAALTLATAGAADVTPAETKAIAEEGFLAEPTSKPRTKSNSVAIVPAATFTVSFELSRK